MLAHRHVDALEAMEHVAAELNVRVGHVQQRQCESLDQKVVYRQLGPGSFERRVELAANGEQRIEIAAGGKVEVRYAGFALRKTASDRLAHRAQLDRFNRYA